MGFHLVKAEEVVGAKVEAIRAHHDPAYADGYTFDLIIVEKDGTRYSITATSIAEGDSVGLEIGKEETTEAATENEGSRLTKGRIEPDSAQASDATDRAQRGPGDEGERARLGLTHTCPEHGMENCAYYCIQHTPKGSSHWCSVKGGVGWIEERLFAP